MSVETLDFADLRRAMVDNQLRPYSVTDRAILARMLDVPREGFVPAALAPIAYSDRALDIVEGGESRRMLPPMILARMIQAAVIAAGDRILDAGGAAGYSAAVLAGLGAEVVALETSETMSRAAASNLTRAGIANARAVTGPLEAGYAAAAPYNVILVNGMIEARPLGLLSQLSDGGRLIVINRAANDASGRAGRVVKFEKNGQSIGSREIFDASAPVLPGFAAVPVFAF